MNAIPGRQRALPR